MNSRSIGKIISINQHGVVAEMFDTFGNYTNTSDGIQFIGEVGSYISLYEIGRTIIGEIVGVEEKPQINNKMMSKPNSSRLIYINLIGEIADDKFFFGVSKMPLIFSEVCIISRHDLQIMLEVPDEITIDDSETGATKLNLLSMGKSVIFPDYAVKVNIDKFFGFHFAVFGNTGAGKSNTLAHIIQSIFEKKNYSAKGAKFVVIDSNGEYAQAFSKITENNSDIQVKNYLATEDNTINTRLEIPAWALSADDWALLLHASEKTQIPILKRAIDIAKKFFDSNNHDNTIKNHILASAITGIFNSSDSSPSKYDKVVSVLSTFYTDEINLESTIQEQGTKTLKQALHIDYGKMENIEEVISYLREYICSEVSESMRTNEMIPYSMDEFYEAAQFATLYEGSVSSPRIQEYTATLLTRLQALKDGVQGKIFGITSNKTVGEYISELIGENQIVNINISELDDASGEVVTKVLSKLILDYLRLRDEKADMPVNLIIEEAHRFIHDDKNHGVLGYNIFERIAKEGRKYGLLLGISSQRPSELSKTVVSQCSNFIIHRVQNPDDLQYISRMVPYINQGTIDRLTYLQTGHALVFGTAINLPTITQFAEAVPSPDSQNAKIIEKWYIE